MVQILRQGEYDIEPGFYDLAGPNMLNCEGKAIREMLQEFMGILLPNGLVQGSQCLNDLNLAAGSELLTEVLCGSLHKSSVLVAGLIQK